MSEHYLATPLSKEDILKLKAGDKVYLSGIIYTARDEAHLEILKLTKEGKSLPFDLEGAAVYHCGPVTKETKNGWCAVAVGPTTSARMTKLTPTLLENYNVRAIIGKGGMENIAPVLKGRCVYLSYPGGCAALAVEKIKEVKGVHWLEELGVAEAVWELEVEDFPLDVSIDAYGEDLYQKVMDRAKQKLWLFFLIILNYEMRFFVPTDLFIHFFQMNREPFQDILQRQCQNHIPKHNHKPSRFLSR